MALSPTGPQILQELVTQHEWTSEGHFGILAAGLEADSQHQGCHEEVLLCDDLYFEGMHGKRPV